MLIDVEYNRKKIENLLLSTQLDGIKKLLAFMDKNGFFVKPCSISHHLNITGGLAAHSLSVYDLFSRWALLYNLPITRNEIIITALLHDICKVEDYSINGDGEWVYSSTKRPTHGTRSVEIIEKFIFISEKEREMISWHMGPYTQYYEGGMIIHNNDVHMGKLLHLKNAGYNFFTWSPKGKETIEKNLALVLYFCDHFSTMFLEDLDG